MAVQLMPPQRVADRAFGIVGRFLLVTGAVLIGVYVVARIHAEVMSRVALDQFSEAERKEPTPSTGPGAPTGAKH